MRRYAIVLSCGLLDGTTGATGLAGWVSTAAATTSPTPRDGELARAKYKQICYLRDPGDDGQDVVSYSL
jgi:hypothetical protein